MTTEYLSSDEMIRRAKETLRLAKEDVLPQVDQTLAERGMRIGSVDFSMAEDAPVDAPMGGTMDSPTRAMVDRMSALDPTRGDSRDRRISSSTPDHLIVPTRSSSGWSMPVPASPVNTGMLTTDGRGMRIVGTLLIIIVVIMWVILLIGVVADPTDLGSVVGGGVVITAVPLLAGLLLRRSGKRKGTPV